MKKLLALILTIGACFALSACGSNNTSSSSQSSSSETSISEESSSSETSEESGVSEESGSDETTEDTGVSEESGSDETTEDTGNSEESGSDETTEDTGNSEESGSDETTEDTGNSEESSSDETTEDTGNSEESSSDVNSEDTGNSEESSSGATSEDTSSSEENAQTVTITFKQAGKADVIKTVEKGATLTDIPTPGYKKGYKVEWDRTDFTNLQTDITVTAKETVRTYTVTLIDTQGAVPQQTIRVTYGQSYKLEKPTCHGQEFIAWTYNSTNIALEGTWNIDEADETITLRASWNFTSDY